jgi:hypothetical protein
MPCYRCGARPVDPVRGPSPWKRGVRAGRHVLVCPECQRTHDWKSDLDRCQTCGSTMLVRSLGETMCRSCGSAQSDASGDRQPSPVGGDVTDERLAEEVREAIGRVLGRSGHVD